MGIPVTAREKLGQLIQHHFTKVRATDHQVAARIGVSAAEVEKYRKGLAVPDRETWSRLCGMISKGLWGAKELYSEAMREQDADKDQQVRALRRNGHTTVSNGQAVTNFGDKLVAATQSSPQSTAPAPVPAPATESAIHDDDADRDRRLPEGARSYEQRSRRIEFARAILRSRPHIPTRGPDGILALIRKEFDVGLSDAEIARARDDVSRDRRAAEPKASGRSSDNPTLENSGGAVNDADVSAGIELIMGAIPGLRSMTITVDETGAASVDYQIRRVEVTTVSSSLTVRR